MGKTPISTAPLSFVEIVMRADVETLRAALEARVKVDELLAQREEAYRKIALLEQQVDSIMGEPGVFVFPEPPLPVSGFGVKSAPAKRPAPQPKAASPQDKADAKPDEETEGDKDGEN